MTTYSHAPENYDCPFCRLIRGEPLLPERLEDVIYHDEHVIAFIALDIFQILDEQSFK